MSLLGILFLFFGILISIALHEVGHMVPAKKFGVKVTQYMVGFGPTIWSKIKGDTEYGVKGIPLGGYIRMIGMIPPAKKPARRNTRFAQIAQEARDQSESEIQPGDEEKVFYKLSTPKKLVVMSGGPFMNLFLAFLIFTIAFVGFGVPAATNQVRAVVPCLPNEITLSGECEVSATSSPAVLAGIKDGDIIKSINGIEVSNWSEVGAAIAQSDTTDFALTPIVVERDGQEISLRAEIVSVIRPATEGVAESQSPYLGVSPIVKLQRESFDEVFTVMWQITTATGSAILSLPQRVGDLFAAAFLGEPRDPEGLVGVVGVTRVGGEIAAADLPGSWRFVQLLLLLGAMNMALFLFNMIPLLPLDGGHVAGALYEGARRQFAKFRGKSDPGPADVAKMLPIAYSMASVLIVLALLLIYVDIVNPIRLGL
jgi:membrane-associated protease RseP (regulator of RpoE activity)